MKDVAPAMEVSLEGSTASRPYRILHIESSQSMGGQELRTLLEAQIMAQRGHRLYIIAQPDSFLLERARAVRLPTLAVRMQWWSGVKFFLQLLNFMKKEKIDFMVTHGSIDSWLGALAGRVSSCKPRIIRARHKSSPISQTWKHRFLYRDLPHGIITTAEIIRQHLIQQHSIPPSRVASIPTGVNVLAFSPERVTSSLRSELGVSFTAPIIGTVAFLRKYKGIHVCVEAVRSLSNQFPGMIFLIVGEGPEGSLLKAQVKQLGVEESVRFLGLRMDVPNILASLDIFLLGSLEGEGVPQALLQAMAMELPVVATSVGGIPEVVVEGESGFVVPANDPKALCARLSILIQNPKLRRQMGRRGRQIVEESYSLDMMGQRVEQWYSKIQCHP